MSDSIVVEDCRDINRGAVLDEIPDSLKKFTLCIAKAFYGREHYVILDYIQKNICIKEDDLRQLLKLDQRFLRTILLQLKVDKILKEKLICEESDPRPRRTIYYYINYPAMINVVKYKVDHMRQRLEVKDKDSVLKATYKCLGCSHNYDAMDMDKIFDPVTEELRCWKCREVVEPDETSGPTDETRSSLARFNDQMTSLFLILQSVDGIRLARHLLEPSIKCAESIQPKTEEPKVLQVGEQSFGNTLTNRSSIYQNGITISIEGETSMQKVDEKKAVPWLQNQMEDLHSDPIDKPAETNGSSEIAPIKIEIENLLKEEFIEEEVEGPAVKRARVTDEPEYCDDDEETVIIGGKKFYIDEITPELVSQMTPAEKEAYIRITQEGFDF